MPPEPEREADTRAWLSRAHEDLRMATVALEASPPIPGGALFHCQQAAEKALKGFLTWQGEPFRKTHSLAELGKACVALDASLEPACRAANDLTSYIWRFRYPGEPEDPSLDEARSAATTARKTYGAILSRLPGNVWPLEK